VLYYASGTSPAVRAEDQAAADLQRPNVSLETFYSETTRRFSMRNLAQRLWQDDAGFVVSTELVLVATLLVIGITVGQSTLRDAVISELADTADAINQINQSYSFTAVTGHSSSVSGTVFADVEDFCDNSAGTTGSQGANDGSGQCVDMTNAASTNG
jgi:hypothetical protein